MELACRLSRPDHGVWNLPGAIVGLILHVLDSRICEEAVLRLLSACTQKCWGSALPGQGQAGGREREVDLDGQSHRYVGSDNTMGGRGGGKESSQRSDHVCGSRENNLCLKRVVVRGREEGPRPSPLQLDRLNVQIMSHQKGSP